MKITKITLENLGPYIGKNQFSFDVESPDKNVVLIGGKNGAGKTTFFNAIRVGLYGCRAFGYESNNAKYLERVYQMINDSAKSSKTGTAGVTVSILMDDGKDDYEYTFQRTWPLNTKNKRETLTVTRNGKVLDEIEENDFQSYLLQLIPPDMFKFYFFDGESIKNFVFNGEKNTDFKNAFLKLCGLDTMQLIHDNFLRISNSRFKDSDDSLKQYQEAQNQEKAVEEKLASLIGENDEAENELIHLEEELAKCEKDFLERGGITREEYQNLLSQISREETTRESSRKWLKETANEILPFIVLKKELAELKEQIVREDNASLSAGLSEFLNREELRQELSTVLEKGGVSTPQLITEQIVDALHKIVPEGDGNSILNLSRSERLDILSKINSVQSFDTEKVYSESKTIEESLARLKEIRKQLDKSDSSNAESYYEQRDSLQTRKTKILQKQLELGRNIEQVSTEKITAENDLKKALQKYEDYLKAKSVNDVTAKALLAFSDLQKRLYSKYISDVESSFQSAFRQLINKSDLIDGIKIDNQLQVWPYKNKKLFRTELQQVLSSEGKNAFIEQYGAPAYDAFMNDTSFSAELELPILVKQELSSGEKQIFIMALYQALASLNKVNVPYIIDTPFARIDTQHRNNILRNFFMNLKGQIVVLSTDEEIVGPYEDIIRDSVSDYYLLKHEDNKGTEIHQGKYFGEEIEK